MSFKIIYGDITEMKVDAIVNSANLFFSKGGGVCKAIHDKAGYELTEYCFKELKPGNYCDVKVSPAFALPAKFVIHVITPKYKYDSDCSQLREAIQNVVDYAHDCGFKSVAIPLLGAGHNGYPDEVALSTMKEILEDCQDVEFTLVLK